MIKYTTSKNCNPTEWEQVKAFRSRNARSIVCLQAFSFPAHSVVCLQSFSFPARGVVCVQAFSFIARSVVSLQYFTFLARSVVCLQSFSFPVRNVVCLQAFSFPARLTGVLWSFYFPLCSFVSGYLFNSQGRSTCNFSLQYPCIIHQTDNRKTQTYQEVVILIYDTKFS